MPRVTRSDALDVVTAWNTEDVVGLLKKNGVDEACWKAVEKRQIDGDELLHLTEGKLALWKSDLTRPLIWSLWSFVEELRRCPEQYVEEKPQQPAEPPVEEARSDTSSWDTDFEDDPVTDDSSAVEMRSGVNPAANPAFRNSLRVFQENIRNEAESRNSVSRNSTEPKPYDKSPSPAPPPETTYANFEVGTSGSGSSSSLAPESPWSEPGTLYANVDYPNGEANGSESPATRNASRLHDQKSLGERLKEQLQLMNATTTPTKPLVTPKPEALSKRSREVEVIVGPQQLQKSFLHNKPKINGIGNAQKKMTVPPPAEPTDKPRSTLTSSSEETLRNLPKPPMSIRGFDLVANLPTRPATESDEDEDYDAPYEAFDEQIQQQQQQQQIIRANSKTSICSNRQNSVESVYKPPSQEEEEPYEIYESITESPEENGHNYKEETNKKISSSPPPLPANPPPQTHKTDTRTTDSADNSWEV